MLHDQLPDHRESEPEPRSRLLGKRTAPREHVEDPREELTRDPDARITHTHHGVAAFGLHRELDRAVAGRVLDCVVEEIGDHLHQPIGVSHHSDRLGIDPQRDGRLVLAGRPQHIERLAGEVTQVEALLLQREPSEADARHVEQVVEQPGQMPRLPVQDLEQEGAVRRARALERLEPVGHGAERIA